ncbi:MBL fold metallo-hydrolase [Nocardioides sp.]|uniref:MBL fold metallo-hydrolase n=1 Tax=Nocardioides sp. TaxID=35761 RepID=UPI0035121B74
MRIAEVAEGLHLVTGTNVNWIVVSEGSSVTLIDSGYPNDGEALLASLAALGHGPEDVEAVLLTHAHLDHLGGVRTIRRHRPVEVLTSEEEARHARREYLDQITPLQMLAQCGRPAGRRWVAQTLRAVLPHASISVDDARGVALGEPLDLPGRPVPVATSGHTPGHTAWLLPAHGALASGDALVTGHPISRRGEGPQLLPSVFAADEVGARDALLPLRDLPVDVVLPGHGEVHRGPIGDAVDRALDAG